MVRERLLISYIDDENGQKIEQREFDISWGHLFFIDRLKLIEVPRASDFEITVKPINGLETLLPPDCHTDKTGKVGRIIFLRNRKFFGERNVSRIYLFVKSPISLDYRSKISIMVYPTCLKVNNENPIEIRNVRQLFPDNMALGRIAHTTQHIEHVRIEIPLPLLSNTLSMKVGECRQAQLAVIMIIKVLPPKQGNIPGSIDIPLSD